MAKNGMLLDLTDKDIFSTIDSGMLQDTLYEGKSYILPISMNAAGVFYNVKIFEENNIEIPTTYEELIAVCEKLKAAGITPFALPDKTMVYQRMERMMSFMSEDDTEFKQIAAGELDAKDSKLLQNYANASLQIVNYMTPESLGAEYTESYQQLIAGQAEHFANTVKN